MTDLLESSVEPDTLAGETDAPADAGSRKRKVWSFPRFDEAKAERPPLSEEEWSRVLKGSRTMVYLVTREQREWAGDQAHQPHDEAGNV